MLYEVITDWGKGTQTDPFFTINKAASLASAGDTITVHEGTYREWVRPAFAGLSDKRRIVYQAAKEEKVIIKGSEVIKDWTLVEGTVWKTELQNAFFKEYNPYEP